MFLLVGIFITALSFIIQVRPRFSIRHFGVDSWRHLMVADYIRENKHYPKWMDKFLIESLSDYQPGLRFLLAAFHK